MKLFADARSKMIAAGIACGVLCALFVFLYIQEINGQTETARAEALARYGGEQLEVCVAAHDLSVGTVIGETDIQTKLWVVDLLPASAVKSSSEILGRQVTSPILQGEVVSLKRFEDQAFSIEVPTGMSAVCVPAKAVQAVGGALSPGMKVDVYATGNTTTARIGQEVLVLATSANATGNVGDAAVSWITLAIDPRLVQEFVIAAQESKLYFVLPSAESIELPISDDAKDADSHESAQETHASSVMQREQSSAAQSSDGAQSGGISSSSNALPLNSSISKIVIGAD